MQIPDIIVRLHQNVTGEMSIKSCQHPCRATIIPRNFVLTAHHLLQEDKQRKGDMNGQNGEKGCCKSEHEASYLLSFSGWSLALTAPSTLMLKQRPKNLIFPLRTCGRSTSTC